MSTLSGGAWVRLSSRRQLNLLEPSPYDWTDEDLARGLSRTYRWGCHSKWDLPLSVAQHSLTVLAIREQQEPRPLPPDKALRELLHDAEEGLLGFDCSAMLKPHLGEAYARIIQRLHDAVTKRYNLPVWDAQDLFLHRVADELATASEALHVAGWSRDAMHETLGIHRGPLTIDPSQRESLGLPPGLEPWQPWPPSLAAKVFLDRLLELDGLARREAKFSGLRAAFSRLPPGARARATNPVMGSALRDTLVIVEAGDGSASYEGIVVAGERDAEGHWRFDAEFTIFTTDGEPSGELILCHGCNYNVEVQ